MQQPQLIARDIYKSFRMGARRIEVLRGISMDIAHNETVFLSGASGAGKTTLLYTLAGLERPESGTVKFEGRELYSGSSSAEARLRNEKMGFVFQGYFLLPELTALENVLLPAMIGRRTTKGEAEESLAAVGLADRMHHLPAELSGGEQQRVAIARALTNNPDIIFADEPTGKSRFENGRRDYGSAAESGARPQQNASCRYARHPSGNARRSAVAHRRWSTAVIPRAPPILRFELRV